MTRVEVEVMAKAMHQMISDPDTDAYEARLREVLARYRTTPDLAMISEKLRGARQASRHIPSEGWIAEMLAWVFCVPGSTHISDNAVWQGRSNATGLTAARVHRRMQ
jgi:hypothetical protein